MYKDCPRQPDIIIKALKCFRVVKSIGVLSMLLIFTLFLLATPSMAEWTSQDGNKSYDVAYKGRSRFDNVWSITKTDTSFYTTQYSFFWEVDWLNITPLSGALHYQGHSVNFSHEIDASGLAPGTYSARVLVYYSDPFQPDVRTRYITVRVLSEDSSLDYLDSIAIYGPNRVRENTLEQYNCYASYCIGSVSDVTNAVAWSENSNSASINSSGLLAISEITADLPMSLQASYGTKSDSRTIRLLESSNLEMLQIDCESKAAPFDSFIRIPVTFALLDGFSGVMLRLTYDPNVLEAPSVVKGSSMPDSFQLDYHSPAQGELNFILGDFSEDPAPVPNYGTAALLNFRIRSDAQVGQVAEICLSSDSSASLPSAASLSSRGEGINTSFACGTLTVTAQNAAVFLWNSYD